MDQGDPARMSPYPHVISQHIRPLCENYVFCCFFLVFLGATLFFGPWPEVFQVFLVFPRSFPTVRGGSIITSKRRWGVGNRGVDVSTQLHPGQGEGHLRFTASPLRVFFPSLLTPSYITIQDVFSLPLWFAVTTALPI